MAKTIVIKYGGSLTCLTARQASQTKIKAEFFKDLVALQKKGFSVIVVHGGGPEINFYLQKFGKKPKFIDGLRYTDAETMELVEMVLSGKVNKSIVAEINTLGGKAIGLNGKDARLIEAKKLSTGKDLGLVGDITKINTAIIKELNKKYILVVSPIGIGKKGETYNINADAVANSIATSVQAQRLILVTDVRGVLASPEDKNSTIKQIRLKEIENLLKYKVITGGMIPKIRAAQQALVKGVKEIDIVDGHIPHVISKVIVGKKGLGTRITR